MLEIILCPDRKENTRRLLTRICAEAVRGKQILVTPEQFSHAAERELCRMGGDSISRYAEVLSFSRLASRVFSIEGGAADTETDAGGRLLMMSLAVEQVRSRLKIFGSAAAKPEFLLRLLDTLEEFRSFCVTPAALRAAAVELGGALAVKTEEFALLMESYAGVCEHCGQNPETKLNRLLSALETSDFAQGKTFYFDGFTDFNGIQREILAQLLASGAEVKVSLTCNSLEHPGQQYETAQETARQLLALAASQGIRTRCMQLSPEKASSALEYLREGLFGGSAAPWGEPQDAVTLCTAPELYAECRWAAGEILRLVSSGVRWREITVVCTQEASYRPVLESLLRSAEIPAYFAGDRSLLQEPVIHFLLCAMEAATAGLEQETVLTYLKSEFSPLEQERCDRLENYVLLWNISGSRWERPWTMCPYGFARPQDAAGEALLAELNESRALALQPLLALRDGLRRAGTTGEMVLAFHAFLEALSFRERLNEQATALYEAGDLQRAQEYAQMYGILCTVLEQTYGVLGRSERTPEDFFAVLRTALSQYQIGSIPASLDCVTVGGLMSQRRCDTEYLFLLGANEGVFPTNAENQSLLTDSERLSLIRLGIGVAPTADGRLSRELAGIHDVLSAPSRRIYLSATEGKEAYFFRRAARLFPDAQTAATDRELVCRSAREHRSYLAPRLHLCENEASAELDALRRAADYRPGALSPATVTALYGRTLRLSSTKIDCLAGCRFAYYLKYGLRALERRTAELDAPLYGTFVHFVLEHTVRQTMQEGGFAVVSRERVLAIADTQMERYAETELASLMESERERYLFRRTFREVRQVVGELYAELSQSEFRPHWLELGFTAHGPLPPVHISGELISAELEGYVDRADLWRCGERLYFRVVDYKTGKKNFEYTNVANGLGLQMLLYLFALEKNGQRLTGEPLFPAGVLYFPARMDGVTVKDKFSEDDADAAHRKLLRRQGLLLDDERTLHAMEPGEGAPVYLPYSLKKGERTGYLASARQLRALEGFVMDKVASFADGLARGEVAPNPYCTDENRGACSFCPYASLCGEDVPKRWLEKIPNAEAFWSIIGEEAAHG